MSDPTALSRPLRVHLTNVAGAGATQLLQSLLPALERQQRVHITEIHLPDRGALANYKVAPTSGLAVTYRRHLPNAMSRLFECIAFARRFNGDTALLVLGDLPLRCTARQTVFVQTPHLASPARSNWSLDGLKFAIARLVFRFNASHARTFIVQTSLMQQMLAASYPGIAHKIHVIAQPVPSWLLDSPRRRTGRRAAAADKLTLVYPAAMYPHKNHRLLYRITAASSAAWPVERLLLTLPAELHPAPEVAWIGCVGFLSPQQMIQTYDRVDGLLFLSTDESYGFPLIEAMFKGLPIVCPDLPYARALCADGAIYFDPHAIDSLQQAVASLQARLAQGWWPDWSAQLAHIPKDWDTVAIAMIDVVFGSPGDSTPSSQLRPAP